MTRPITRRVPRVFLLAALALPLGCAAPPDAPPSHPTLADIHSKVTPPGPPPDAANDPGSIPADAAAQAHITTVLVPLNESINAAWKNVDEEVFHALTRGVWHSNGLRVGLLPQKDLADFLHALPGRRDDDRQQRIIGGATPTPLRRSRPLAARFFADLTVPPFAPKREELRGHRLQLLIGFRPQSGGFTLVDLTPHHHKPRQMLRARTAQEKLMDGRLFEELAITVAVPRDQYLILSLARDPATLPPEVPQAPADPENTDENPPPTDTPIARLQPAPTTPTSTSTSTSTDFILQNAQEPPAETPNPFPRKIQPLPLNLGRALMTQAGPGGEAQVILIMHIEPLE